VLGVNVKFERPMPACVEARLLVFAENGGGMIVEDQLIEVLAGSGGHRED